VVFQSLNSLFRGVFNDSVQYLPPKPRMVSCDGLKEEPTTNVFSHHTARETEENYE